MYNDDQVLSTLVRAHSDSYSLLTYFLLIATCLHGRESVAVPVLSPPRSHGCSPLRTVHVHAHAPHVMCRAVSSSGTVPAPPFVRGPVLVNAPAGLERPLGAPIDRSMSQAEVKAASSTEFESDESDSDDEEEQLSSEFQAIQVVQQADALLNRLAARLACADRRERASTRRASVALMTNIRELKADSTVISYADGVGRVSHRGRLVSDELCHVRGQEYSLKVRREKARACYRYSSFQFRRLFLCRCAGTRRARGSDWCSPSTTGRPQNGRTCRGTRRSWSSWSRAPSTTRGAPRGRLSPRRGAGRPRQLSAACRA